MTDFDSKYDILRKTPCSGENGVSDILRLAIYLDKVLESWGNDGLVSGVDIVKANVLRIMDSLWDSGIDLIGHFMEKGRNLFLENVESLFDEGKVMKTIDWIKKTEL